MILSGCGHDDFPEQLIDSGPVTTLDADRGARHVHVHLNVPYAHTSGIQLHLHVLQSCLDLSYVTWQEMAAERLPCIVFVQGSGWGPQDMGSSMEFWIRIARRGFVVALIEYRSSDVAAFPAQVEDAEAAVRWLIEHHDRFGIDPKRMVLAGDSSGGHTVLMVHTAERAEHDPVTALKGYVDFYGPTDLGIGNRYPTIVDHESADSPEGRLLGGHDLAEVPDLVAAASPLRLIPKDRGLAPLLMVHGTKDRIVPIEHTRRYAQALREAGHQVELIQVRDADHGCTALLFSDQLADALEDFITRCVTAQ